MTVKNNRHRVSWYTDLEVGKVEKIVREPPAFKEVAEKVRNGLNYLEENRGRMRYVCGLPGAGAARWVGGGGGRFKTLIGKRLNQSGTEWSLQGANDNIISLRWMCLSGRVEKYRESGCA
mgnify:CR=1 FL=1